MSNKVIITVNEGRIRGIKKKSFYSGVDYFSFLGVPYGQSTAGRARFKDPVKVKPWHGILDATEEKYGCMQYSNRKYEINGSEDCLYNNIHIPMIPTQSTPLKAVIVNFHPGAFVSGSPDPHYYGSPEFLMHQNFIYICTGYRLHILGNLNLGLEDCSGNQYLKDVILGLTWIKENIKAFGGDPENITILGSSSGSAIVHELLLLPQAKGLYHKAVLMGMYMFCPVIVIPLELEHISIAYKMAVGLGFKGKMEERKKLLKFYKNLPMQYLISKRIERYLNFQSVPVFPASPYMRTTDLPGRSEFSTSIEKLIPSTNRVPIIIGFCEKEGILALLRSVRTSLHKNFHQVLRQNQHGWGKNLTDDDLKFIQKQIESFYLNNGSIANAKLSTICDILTDMALSDVYDTVIDVISEDFPSSVYVYKFQYDGHLCTIKTKCIPLIEEHIEGTYHAGDYSYWSHNEDLLGKSLCSIRKKDREVIERFVNLIGTFAKTGNPNNTEIGVQWEPSTPTNPCYLSINETSEMKNEHLIGDRMEFWKNIKEQFKKPCN